MFSAGIGLPKRLSAALAVCLGFVVSACGSAFDDVDTLGLVMEDINALPVEQAQTYVAGKTVMTFDGPQDCVPILAGSYTTFVCPSGYHGTQIEYFHPAGFAFLWYPGNRGPVPARWKLEDKGERHKICFKYPSRSYNPLTGQHGGKWNCTWMGSWANDIVEIGDGDIFNLSSGRLPHVLDKKRTSFGELLATK